MREKCGLWILLAALGMPTAQAQESEESLEPGKTGPVNNQAETLTLRVTGKRAGSVVTVDRGSADGLREGDRVTLQPLDGRVRQGRVTLVLDRSAEVRIDGQAGGLPAGTRGFVKLPADRFASPAEVVAPGAAASSEAPTHAPWENNDVEFEDGMPLLHSIDGVRPQERPPILSGRVYSIGDFRRSSDRGRSDDFLRVGTELHQENPLGRGGQLYFMGEVNYRAAHVDAQLDEAATLGRLDRFSYAIGGTRFERSRHEFGRFLQDGVPELGILDGYEWNQRGESGHRFGTSVGFLPEPTPHMSTGDDFAISGFYQWAADEREELTATTAYQKSWHTGVPDRDLFLLKLDYWESEDWDFHGTGWVDWYTSGDIGKSTGPDVTRFIATTSRRWRDGDGLIFGYTHDEFPQLDRFEFPSIDEDILVDDRDDRVSADGWTWVRHDRRLFARSGAWVDRDDYGGDLELGIEQLDLWLDGNRTEVSLFGAQGKFSSLLGFRASYGVQLALTHWSASYEYFQSNQEGFSDDNDNLDHHRLLGNVDLSRASGWNLSLRGGLERYSDQYAAVAGFYLQRSF